LLVSLPAPCQTANRLYPGTFDSKFPAHIQTVVLAGTCRHTAGLLPFLEYISTRHIKPFHQSELRHWGRGAATLISTGLSLHCAP